MSLNVLLTSVPRRSRRIAQAAAICDSEEALPTSRIDWITP
jgi:hypothetical protein